MYVCVRTIYGNPLILLAPVFFGFFPQPPTKGKAPLLSGKAIDSYSLDRGFKYCHWNWERDTQHYDILHNDTPHNGFIWDTQHKCHLALQFRVPLRWVSCFLLLCWVSPLSVAAECRYAECRYTECLGAENNGIFWAICSSIKVITAIKLYQNLPQNSCNSNIGNTCRIFIG
jgi:hypothetical protein